MPRSVNNVASRAKRKRIMKLAKGFFGRKKNVWTVAKNAIEKGFTTQFTKRVIKSPPGRCPTCRKAVRSTFIIIGTIMSQISTAMGKLI